MAGYSGTPLAHKLGIKDNHRVLLINAPDGFVRMLEGLPDSAVITTRPSDEHDVILIFAKDTRALQQCFAGAQRRLEQSGGLWVAWPKKASGIATDLVENIVRDLALASGLVDNKVCAIDQTWSGLRLVVRLKDRKPTQTREVSPKSSKAAARTRPRRAAAPTIKATKPRRRA
jgi:hypothetical protein